MKYVYWFFISCLTIWEMNELKDIFGFSTFWQHSANIVLVAYFAYLLDVNFNFTRLVNKFTNKKKHVNS